MHSLFKGLFVVAFMFVGNDQSMGLWRRAVAPGTAALAVIFLGAASASGIDQMANAKIHGPTSATVSAVVADGQTSLHHVVLRGLAKGALPGGYPYDEPRDERSDEDYQETLHQHRSSVTPAE
ncbi:hypothetical protein [Arthrobacter sp. NPDC057013]|uniref:hypothetical protein n=1 Tax=Arthrobacter sp. NPDC057013 TaxID=3345999 RepID=UPI00362905EB